MYSFDICSDSPAPSTPNVSDETVQTYKNTIDEQTAHIKSLEEKLAELETSLQTLVSFTRSSVFLKLIIWICAEIQ